MSRNECSKGKVRESSENGWLFLGRSKRTKAQQEMVGFILIVVLVMIGALVFLVISVRNSPEPASSVRVENMLGAVMKQTTDCAIPAEPYYKTFEDLFKSCYKGSRCENMNVSACDYLNESLTKTLGALMDSEAAVSAYELNFFLRDEEGQQGLMRMGTGNCTGRILAAQRSIVSGSESLIVRLRICSGD